MKRVKRLSRADICWRAVHLHVRCSAETGFPFKNVSSGLRVLRDAHLLRGDGLRRNTA